jgi:prenyltransferase beta subunit
MHSLRIALLSLAVIGPSLALCADDQPLDLTLPAKFYAVPGLEMNIYFDNIILTQTPAAYRFDVTCKLGTVEKRRWTVTPTVNDVGNHDLTIKVFDANDKQLASDSTKLEVVAKNAGADKSISILIIGDSLTHATAYPNEIARLFALPENPRWKMLGTHKPKNAGKGVAHEGYGGWTWQRFVSKYEPQPDGTHRKRSSPFVYLSDKGTPQLNFKRYLKEECNNQPPDFVVCLLGINDCFGAPPDDRKGMDARIDGMLKHADTLLKEIQQAAPNSQLGMCITTPGNSRQEAFEANYKDRYLRWGWKRIQHRLAQRLLTRFEKTKQANLFVIPTQLNLDPIDGYPTNNGVHPNTAGYQQIGASIYSALKSRLSVVKESTARSAKVTSDSVAQYVLSCRKTNGAFGPTDQSYTDAAWNYPAIKTLKLLDVELSNPQAVLANGLGQPTGHVGPGHWQFFHQHMIRHALGQPVEYKHQQVQLVHQGFKVLYYGSPFGTDGDTFFKSTSNSKPDPRDVEASELGFYNLSSLYYLLLGLKASGREPANVEELVSFIEQRQAPNGGFVDVRVKDGRALDVDTHVVHTMQAIVALSMLGSQVPRAEQCADFIGSCQLPAGGFRWSPQDEAPGNYADIYYTSAALTALKTLGAKPPETKTCVDWINGLQNHDGGFGDQPGWRSRLYSTYYAVDALATLTGNSRLAIAAKTVSIPTQDSIPDNYEVHQALFKTPVVTADELPTLQARGLDLIAMKTDDFVVGRSIQKAARAMQPPMEVLLCPEAYPHRAARFGNVSLHHIGNMTLDPSQETQQAIWQQADTVGKKGLAWLSYQNQVIRPLQESGTLCYPEQDFEMELALSAYDDGVHTARGYNAILAGFNWSPRDFVRVFPWRERYFDKLIPIADCDAHGDLTKWSPQLDHTRHLFISPGPSAKDFQTAATNGRVVCVILDAEGVEGRATLYGPPAAVAFAKSRIDSWKWWD